MCRKFISLQSFHLPLPISSLSGKQDYKKTKPVLKATRLKAEAKKNSSGFRVRLNLDFTFCFTFLTSVICMSSSLPACLSVLVHLLVRLSANHLLFISLPACLRARLTRSNSKSSTLSQLISMDLMGMQQYESTWTDMTWAPAYLLKICEKCWKLEEKTDLPGIKFTLL